MRLGWYHPLRLSTGWTIQYPPNQCTPRITHIDKRAQHYKDVYLPQIIFSLDIHRVTKTSELYSYIRTFVLYYGGCRPISGTSKRHQTGDSQSPPLTKNPYLFQSDESRKSQRFRALSVRVAVFYGPGIVRGPCLSVAALATTNAAVAIGSVPTARNIPNLRPGPDLANQIKGLPRSLIPAIDHPL